MPRQQDAPPQGARRPARRFRPKSEALRLGAVAICGIGALAVRQSIGLEPASGGPALVALMVLATAAWLTSGKRVEVEPASGRVRTRWMLAGLPLRGRDVDMAIERVELRPEWMHGWGLDLRRYMVYDLVLAGRRVGGEPPKVEQLALDLKEDQLLFRLSERRAREAARALDLPVSVRWDRLFDDIPCDERARGASGPERFAYPAALGDWRRWL